MGLPFPAYCASEDFKYAAIKPKSELREGGQRVVAYSEFGPVSFRTWISLPPKEKTLICIHGFGSTSEAFIKIAEALKDSFNIVALDLAGSGQSGVKGDFEGLNVHESNISMVVDQVRRLTDGSSLYGLGHSLGASYVAWYSWLHPTTFRALVLASPQTGRIKLDAVSNVKKVLFALTRVVAPRKKVNLPKLFPELYVSRRGRYALSDDSVVKEWSVRSLFSIYKLISLTPKILAQVKIPTMLLVGKEDRLIDHDSVREVYELMQARNKELVIVEGADHWFFGLFSHVQFEDETDDRYRLVVEDIRRWIINH